MPPSNVSICSRPKMQQKTTTKDKIAQSANHDHVNPQRILVASSRALTVPLLRGDAGCHWPIPAVHHVYFRGSLYLILSAGSNRNTTLPVPFTLCLFRTRPQRLWDCRRAGSTDVIWLAMVVVIPGPCDS